MTRRRLKLARNEHSERLPQTSVSVEIPCISALIKFIKGTTVFFISRLNPVQSRQLSPLAFLKYFKWLCVRAARWHQTWIKALVFFCWNLSHCNHQGVIYHQASGPVTEISSWQRLSTGLKYYDWWDKDCFFERRFESMPMCSAWGGGVRESEGNTSVAEKKKKWKTNSSGGCLLSVDCDTSRETYRWRCCKRSPTFRLNCGILDEHCSSRMRKQWMIWGLFLQTRIWYQFACLGIWLEGKRETGLGGSQTLVNSIALKITNDACFVCFFVVFFKRALFFFSWHFFTCIRRRLV